MNAYFVRPLPITISASTGFSTTFAPSNVTLDPVGLVAKATGTTGTITADLGSSQMVDTVVVISNIANASATVRVEITSASVNQVVNAFTGTKDPIFSTKTVIKLPAPVSASSVKVTVTGAQSGFEVQRLIVGKRIETEGISFSSDHSIEDQSIVEKFDGGEHVREYPTRPVWKVKMSLIDDAKWHGELYPFFLKVGHSKPFFFVPADIASRVQIEAVFGKITSQAKAEVTSFNTWATSFSVTGLSS